MKWGPVGGCGVRCRQIYRRCCCHYRVDRLQCPSDGRFFRFSTNSTEGLGRTESLGLIQHKELIQSSAESSEHVNTGHGESERERERVSQRETFLSPFQAKLQNAMMAFLLGPRQPSQRTFRNMKRERAVEGDQRGLSWRPPIATIDFMSFQVSPCLLCHFSVIMTAYSRGNYGGLRLLF